MFHHHRRCKPCPSIGPNLRALWVPRNQLLQYFESHSFLYHDQSDFRKGHSTETALAKLLDDLLENINEGMMNDIFFILHTIDHDLLLFKLQRCSVENNEPLWFTDYFSLFS